MADTSTPPPATTAPGGAPPVTLLTGGVSGAPPPASPASSTAGAAPTKTEPPGSPSTSAPDNAGTAPGEKPPEQKSAETKPPDTPLELKLPDGFQPGPALDEFKGLAKELGISAQAAQKLVDFQAKHELARAQAAEQQQATWAEALKTDKEIGGAQFEANGQLARKAMLRFATPELRTFLNDSGMGNHPELVRLMYRVGKAIGEDSIAGSNGAPPGNPSDPEKYLRDLYPTMFAKES